MFRIIFVFCIADHAKVQSPTHEPFEGVSLSMLSVFQALVGLHEMLWMTTLFDKRTTNEAPEQHYKVATVFSNIRVSCD